MESLVFLDVETTGLDAKRHRIIEVYMLKVLRGGEVGEFHSLINPKQAIPKLITDITGLNAADVAEAPSEEEIALKIRTFIGESTIVAHNLPFDKRFLQAMFKRTECDPLRNPEIDTLRMSREAFPKLCIYPDGGGSHKLKNLMYHFGLDKEFQNSHRAKDDVFLLIQVFRQLEAYLAGETDYFFPRHVSHGCPSCGSAMRLVEGDTYRKLVCAKSPHCQESLVV